MPYSSFRKGHKKKRDFSVVKIGIDIQRDELIGRINARVDEMMAMGLMEEAKANYEYRHLNALNTVGYKELFEYFDGRCSLEEAVRLPEKDQPGYGK